MCYLPVSTSAGLQSTPSIRTSYGSNKLEISIHGEDLEPSSGGDNCCGPMHVWVDDCWSGWSSHSCSETNEMEWPRTCAARGTSLHCQYTMYLPLCFFRQWMCLNETPLVLAARGGSSTERDAALRNIKRLTCSTDQNTL